jgi:hypothetical protein
VSSTLPQLRQKYVVSPGAVEVTDVEGRLLAAQEGLLARRAAESEISTAEKVFWRVRLRLYQSGKVTFIDSVRECDNGHLLIECVLN